MQSRLAVFLPLTLRPIGTGFPAAIHFDKYFKTNILQNIYPPFCRKMELILNRLPKHIKHIFVVSIFAFVTKKPFHWPWRRARHLRCLYGTATHCLTVYVFEFLESAVFREAQLSRYSSTGVPPPDLRSFRTARRPGSTPVSLIHIRLSVSMPLLILPPAGWGYSAPTKSAVGHRALTWLSPFLPAKSACKKNDAVLVPLSRSADTFVAASGDAKRGVTTTNYNFVTTDYLVPSPNTGRLCF